jgi:hypothetical protein
MIETLGSDESGSVAWRWRPLDPADEIAHETEINLRADPTPPGASCESIS